MSGYLDLGHGYVLHPDAIITIYADGEQRKITTKQLGELLNCKIITQQNINTNNQL